MRNRILFIALFIVVATSFSSLFAQNKKAKPKEKIELEIIHDAKLADDIKLAQEQLMNEERFLGTLITLGNIAYSMIVGTAVDASANLLKQAIDKSNAKYKAEWLASVSKDFFYNDVSCKGSLDPSGMQFGGFKASRILQNPDNKEKLDTAFYFSARIKDVKNIVKTSRFTLELDTLLIDLSKTKAKLPKRKTFNLNVEIKITSSWVNDATQYYNNQEMGVFTIDLKNIKYDPANPIYIVTSNDSTRKLSGSCFIIPRSTYGKIIDGNYTRCYGMGEYAMTITIKEQTNYKNIVKDFFDDYVIKVTETYGKSVKESKIIETGIKMEMPNSSEKNDSQKTKSDKSKSDK
jgi:hypothetical protein